MYCLNVKREEEENGRPINAERLLRSLGVSGRLVGFKFLVFIAEKLVENPDEWQWLTKGVYPDTGKRFDVDSRSVERGIRGVIKACWEREDRKTLDYVAGVHLEKRPTNAEFIDMLVAFLRYKNSAAAAPSAPAGGSSAENETRT